MRSGCKMIWRRCPNSGYLRSTDVTVCGKFSMVALRYWIGVGCHECLSRKPKKR